MRVMYAVNQAYYETRCQRLENWLLIEGFHIQDEYLR